MRMSDPPEDIEPPIWLQTSVEYVPLRTNPFTDAPLPRLISAPTERDSHISTDEPHDA
jgi:hypothetical protein